MTTITATEQGTSTATGIIVTGPEPIMIDPASAKRRPALNQDEARMLTTEIQRASVRLWLLVTEAHDRAAHTALGYDAWDDYVRAEFKMSPSRSYQLVDTGHVMRALAAAGADIDHMAPPPTRVVAKVKDRLPEVKKATQAALRDHGDPIKALREMARVPRAPISLPEQRTTNGEDVESPPPPEGGETDAGTRVVLITCPACTGDGKVTRGLANRLRPFMKSLVSK